MYVARVLYPIEVLGPGKRVGIWLCGCLQRCKGCSNPELWEMSERYATTPETIFKLVETIAEHNTIDGFTITGGEPMLQSNALQTLILLLRKFSDDVLVYTGYEIEELTVEQLNGISVLIDGAYIEKQNNNCILRGSENQHIHIIDDRQRKKYVAYCTTAKNQIQNFITANGTISVGIHRNDFEF